MREEDETSVFEVEYRLDEASGGTRFTEASDFELRKLPRILHARFRRGVQRDARATPSSQARARAVVGCATVRSRSERPPSAPAGGTTLRKPAAGSRHNPRVSMRAVGIETYGGALTLLELPEPPPLEAGEVLIEVKAAGVANWDEFVRTGDWDVGRAPPLALGVEAAGEVVGVGPDVEWPAAGVAVMTHPLPLPYQGCWADRLRAPPHPGAQKTPNAPRGEGGGVPVSP